MRRLQVQEVRRTVFLPMMVFLASCIVLLLGGQWVHNSLLANKRAEVEASLAPYGNALTTTLNQQLGLTEALTAFVQGHPDPQNLKEHFPAYAEGLISNSTSVRAIQIYPPTGTVMVYPVAGNEEVAARTLADLLNDDRPQVRADVERAISARRPILSEPYELRQGGLGLVMRHAVHQGDTLWGFSIVILDVPRVITAASLNGSTPGLRIALNSSDRVLHGDAGVLSEDPVIYPIELSERTWELAAVPVNGWQASIESALIQFMGVGFFIILLVVFITYRLTSYQSRLRAAVQERTIELDHELTERKQSDEQVRRLHRVLSMLSEITQSIVRNNDIPALMNLACEVAVQRGGYELAWVGLVSSNTRKMRPVAGAGRAADLLQELDIAPDLPLNENDPISRAVHTGRHAAHILVDLQTAVLPGLKSTAPSGFASMASFPLIVGERVRGTLNLYAGTPNHFDESELKMLDDLVKDLSFAIAHSEEEEQRQWAEAETLQINRLYQVLSQVNQLVLRAATREDLFSNVCQILVELGHFKLAWVGWVDPTSRFIQTAAQRGDPTGVIQRLSIPMDDPGNQSGPLCTAVQTGRAYISIDFENTLWKSMASEVGFDAMGSFPLRLNGVVQGALNVHIDNRDYFRIREINLLQEVADDVSFALEHQRQEQLRAQSDLALVENNRLLTALINSTSDIIIFSLDRNYRYTTFNQKHRHEMRSIWNADIQVGDNILEFMTIPQLRESAQRSFDRALAGETFSEINHQPDADIFYEFVWNPIRDDNGTVTGLTAFILDITEQKRAAAAIEESERRYRLAQQAADIGSWEWNIALDRLTWSDEMYVVFDKDPDSFTPTNLAVMDSILDEDRPRVQAAVEAAMAHGVPYQVEYRIHDRNQVVRWVEARGEVIYDDRHRPLHAAGTTQNVTVRKQAEIALSHTTDLMRYIIEHDHSAIAVMDRDLRYTYVSQRFLEDYRISLQNVIGMQHYEVFPDIPNTWKDVHQRALAGEVLSAEDDPFHREDGTTDIIRWECRPWYDHNQAIGGIILYTEVITARKQAEEALRQTSDYLDNLITHANAPIITWDPQLRITRFNRAFERLTGYGAETVIGTHLDILFPAGEREKSLQKIRRAAEGEYWDSVEIPIRCQNSEVRVVLWNSANIYSRDGSTLVSTIAQGQDITDRKQAEEALRESEQRYRELFLSNPHPMWVYDLETLQFLEVNDSAVSHYGYSRSEFLAMTIKDIRPEEDIPALLENVASTRDSLSHTSTWRHRLKDGRIRDVEITSHELNYAGRPARLVLVLDITERKLAEEKLRESEERYRNILTVAPVGIAIHQEGKIVFTNPAGLHLLGAHSFDQLIGKDIRTIIHPDQLEHSAKRIQRMMAGEDGLYPVEDKYIRLDGTVIDVEVVATRLTYQGKPAVQVLVTDITESKRNREELIAWNARLEQRVSERTAQLEASNNELEAFAYSVSHDLRAPLRAIDGFSRILQQQYAPVLDEEGRRLLNVVRNSTGKMDHLITDLLALSRVSRSQLSYTLIDMNELVDTLYHEMASPEAQENIVFTCQNLPAAAADLTLMRQVWTNLISNAIKYTSPNADRRIDVSGYEKDGFCTYQIADNGVGFNPRYSDKLFGVFQRLHKESEFEGTGVGLAIVQRIVHRHGGRVWANGDVGQGATFYFSLPQRQVNDA